MGELILSHILDHNLFDTKSKLSAAIYNIMYGMNPRDVHQLKSIVESSKGSFSDIA